MIQNQSEDYSYNNNISDFKNYINVLKNNQDWIIQDKKHISTGINELKLNANTKMFLSREHDINSEKLLEMTSKKIEEVCIGSKTCSINLMYLRTEIEEDKSNSSMISTSNCSRKSSGEISFKAKYKTEICKFWELNKTCRFGDTCAFAHGNTEIRKKLIPSNSYKTKKCKQFFDFGFCLYGSRCQFLHYMKDLITFSYKNSLKNLKFTASNLARRLMVFEGIFKVQNFDVLEIAEAK